MTPLFPRILKSPLSWFYLLAIPLAFVLHDDFGVSTDEQISRNNGKAAYFYAEEMIQNLFRSEKVYEAQVNYFKRIDRDYGVIFEAPLYALTNEWRSEQDSATVFKRRHLYTHLFFLAACGCFYLMLAKRFDSRWAGTAGLLLMVLSPRMYAESYYNSKDVIFMAMVMIALWGLLRVIRKPGVATLLCFSLCTALATSTRLAGLFLPVTAGLVGGLAVVFPENRNPKRFLRLTAGFAAYTICAAVLLRIFWPFIWIDPVNNFINAVTAMSDFRWVGEVFFCGSWTMSDTLPWNYVPVWIGITTPVMHLLLFGIGILFLLRTVFTSLLKTQIINQDRLQDLAMALFLFVPLTYLMLTRPVLYDGWRHVYFLYPPVIYLAVLGAVQLAAITGGKGRVVKGCLALAGLMGLAEPVAFMLRNHPYQFVYYQPFVRSWAMNSFENDYWGVSYGDGLRYILANDSREHIRVKGEGDMPVNNNQLLLTPEEAERIQTVVEGEADYLVSSYRYGPVNGILPVHTIFVEGHPICGVHPIPGKKSN